MFCVTHSESRKSLVRIFRIYWGQKCCRLGVAVLPSTPSPRLIQWRVWPTLFWSNFTWRVAGRKGKWRWGEGVVITRVHSLHVSTGGRRGIESAIGSRDMNYYQRHPEVLTCCPSLSVELVQVPAPEQKVGTCSPAKLVALLGACALTPRDDVVRFQTCCLLRVHLLTRLLFHCWRDSKTNKKANVVYCKVLKSVTTP